MSWGMRDTHGYRIALYIRLSVEDSKTESMSIENQKIALHRFADSMEDVRNATVQEYVDNGYSGTNFERPAVQAMLDDVRAGKINCIIVKDFTRFGRNSIDVGYFMERVFPLYGTRFISLNDAFDSSQLHGDTGGINAAFRYLFAEFYSRDLSIKCKSAMYAKFRRGEYQSRVCPYGYQKSADGRMEPDKNTAPVVRWIFDMAQDGNSVNDIIKELYAKKIQTPRQYQVEKTGMHHDASRSMGVWSEATLFRILHDERYIGTYIIGKVESIAVGGHKRRMRDESEWIRIPGHHPAVVSKETFEKVQEKFPCPKGSKKSAVSYCLKGRVFCGCCGHAMARTKAKRPKFECRYMRVDESALCHGLAVGEKELEECLYKIITKQARLIMSPDSSSVISLSDVQFAALHEYERLIEGCKERKRALYEGMVLQKINLEEYKARKAEIDVDLSRWEDLYAALAKQNEQAQMDEAARNARLALAREIVKTDSLTAALAEKLIDRVEIYPGPKIKIRWREKDFCVEQTERD